MSWLKNMSDEQLRRTITRLESDIESFRARASAVAADLESRGLAPDESALHRRLTGIRKHLESQLTEAQDELSLREHAHAARTGSRFWRRLWGPGRRSRLVAAGAQE